MNLKINALKSIGTGWLRLGIQLIVGFLIAPFILHRLGDYAYGLYALILSIAGYYGFFDLGIRSSVLRYVARFRATGEDEALNRFINTALLSYSIVASVLLLITFIGASYIHLIFHFPPNFLRDARLLFLIVGIAVSLGFPLGVFEGILEGLQRFPSMDLAMVISALLRAALIVVTLTHGLGLLTVALVSMGVGVLRPVAYTMMVFRAIPLRLRWRFVDRASFRLMISYSLPTFFIGLAEQLRFGCDETVIGIFLSSVAITYFSIAAKLVGYAGRLVSNMAGVFTPMSSHFDATGNIEGLQKILVRGTRACTLVIFPVSALLIILGKPIIDLWMGARYVPHSYPVLVTLIESTTLYAAQGAAIRILYGINRHQSMVFVRMAEGAANLSLSILLLHYFGLEGVALGTAIPLTCTSLFFFPPHLCRILKISLSRYFYQSYLLPLGVCAPLIGVLIVLRHVFPAASYGTLLIQVVCGVAAYGAAFAWFFLTQEPLGVKVRGRLAHYIQQTLVR